MHLKLNLPKTIIIAFFLLIYVSCTTNSKGASIDLKKVNDPGSSYPIYQLIFTKNDRIVAKRFYQNGKTILSEGVTPSVLSNIVVIEFIREGKPIQPINLIPVKTVLFRYEGKVVARMERDKNKLKLVEGKIPDGTIVEKYPNGNIKAIILRSHGTRVGPAISLFENGNVKGEGFYKNGYPEGISRRYYKNGNLFVESKMTEGKNIYYKEFHKNGRLKQKIQYKSNGTEWIKYDRDGNVIQN